MNALPLELREEIFAYVVLGPAGPTKWDATHKPDCAVVHAEDPFKDNRPAMDPRTHTCAACAGLKEPGEERVGEGAAAEAKVWVHPWRSTWAPEQSNPYLCTVCYEERREKTDQRLNWKRNRKWERRHGKEKASPWSTSTSTSSVSQSGYLTSPFLWALRTMPCLCARRDLSVLLVCRRWSEEAGRLFWGGTRFAFGRTRECAAFLRALSPRSRSLIRSVSLMGTADPSRDRPEELVPTTPIGERRHIPMSAGWPAEKAARGAWGSGRDSAGLRAAWAELARLPALRSLELDALYLTSRNCLPYVFFSGSQNGYRPALPATLADIRFVQACPTKDKELGRRFVWPRLAARFTVENEGTAGLAVRAMFGEEM